MPTQTGPNREASLLAIGIYALVVAIGPLSIDMYLPTIPTIRGEMGADLSQMQATMAVYLVGLALGQLAYGPLSDAFGRKKPLLGGIGLYLLATIGCALASDIELFIALRGLQALGASAGTVTFRAMIRDRHPPQDVARALTLLTAVMGIAPIVAPLMGSAVLGWFGWRTIFALLGVWSALMLVTVSLWINETHTRAPDRLDWGCTWRGMRRLVRHRQFRRLAFAGAATHSTLMAYLASAPIIFGQGFRFRASEMAGAFAFSGFSYIAGAYLNRQLLRSRQPERLMRVGMQVHLGASATMVVLLGFTGWGGPAALLATVSGLMGSIGIVAPNAVALALAPFRSRAGLAASLMGTLQYGLAALTAFAVGLVASTSQVAGRHAWRARAHGLNELCGGQPPLGLCGWMPDRTPAADLSVADIGMGLFERPGWVLRSAGSSPWVRHSQAGHRRRSCEPKPRFGSSIEPADL